MKPFSEFKIGDKFHAECVITVKEVDRYIEFARIKSAFLDEGERSDKTIIPGRALLAKIEGEFTRLDEIYGNHIVLMGADGDPEWDGRSVRFLSPFYTGDKLKITFYISDVIDMDEEYGRIGVDYEGNAEDGNLVVLSKRNIYRMKKIAKKRPK